MEHKEPKDRGNLILITSLILFLVISVFLVLPEKNQTPPDIFTCQDQETDFNVNISDCRAVQIIPSEAALVGMLLNSQVNGITLLMDPNKSCTGCHQGGYIGLAVGTVQKPAQALHLPVAFAYTEQWFKTPGIRVSSPSDASTRNPIIWFNPHNQSENTIQVWPDGLITINAKDGHGMQAASCKIAITLIESVLTC
ncbi:TPA: hypothetical protein H1011_01370 [archaeon]|jgi:hypothetical protein|uniref:Uncharacterized protein n=1 Tax=Candidatus Undinarchaeum marinum TaxID=2756141 RepID=A0A832V1S5_9ARCH|nr:hypothetical protein [Candidatus Undinarchaeum marinum]